MGSVIEIVFFYDNNLMRIPPMEVSKLDAGASKFSSYSVDNKLDEAV